MAKKGGFSLITIDLQDRSPIYLQLINKIEMMASRGFLAPNEQLPTVRSLAVELSINPNTIQRAYSELEKKGVIYTVPGKGCFVSPSTDTLLNRKKQELLAEVEQQVKEAYTIGIPKKEFLEQCDAYYERFAKEEKK